MRFSPVQYYHPTEGGLYSGRAYNRMYFLVSGRAYNRNFTVEHSRPQIPEVAILHKEEERREWLLDIRLLGRP